MKRLLLLGLGVIFIIGVLFCAKTDRPGFWAQITDTDFNSGVFKQTSISGTGAVAVITLGLSQNYIQRLPKNAPSARYRSSLAYNSARQKTVLFGGYNDSYYFNDTWEWDGTDWIKCLPATSPATRSGHTILVYDSNRQKTILFGGTRGNINLNDTWEWDGTDWIQCLPAVLPPARGRHSLVYDSSRKKTVLFGGFDGIKHLNEIWEWDGVSWSQSLPATLPERRRCQALAYDLIRQKAVLFGGCRGDIYFNDTWEYDGMNWSQRLPATSPPGRDGSAMSYDSVRQKNVLFGGYNGSIYFNDTWEWAGENWKQILPATSPTARYDQGQSYDSIRQKTVLFGGYNGVANNETWEYSTSYLSSGIYISNAIAPPGVSYWGVLNYTSAIPAGTILTVDVLTSPDDSLLVENVLPGTNLQYAYPAIFNNITEIKLRINMSTSDMTRTPVLSD